MNGLEDDLVQAWEIWLRNYTDIDTRRFREEIGKLLSAQRELTTYTWEIPKGLEAYAAKLSKERSTLDLE